MTEAEYILIGREKGWSKKNGVLIKDIESIETVYHKDYKK